jgi:hypothetical protein
LVVELATIVEPITGNGYRAIGAGGLSLGLSAEGATALEALANLGKLVQARITTGAAIVPLQVPLAHPFAQDAGYLRDDPLLDDWKKAMAEARWRLDEESGAL